jgi:Glutamine amidotransferase
MGWNTLDMVREHPVLERLPLGPKGRHAYFVHSYHLNAVNEAECWRAPITAGRYGDGRQGHRDRHAISPGKEPAFWAGLDFELFEMEAVILFPPST